MERAIAPKGAIFDVEMFAGRHRPLGGRPHLIAIVGVDRGDQIVIIERLVRTAAVLCLAFRRCVQRLRLELHRPRGEPASGQCDAQTLLCRANVLELRPRFVLPQSRAPRRAGETDQCRGVKWPFEERDVAQRLEQPYRARVALEPTAARGQDDEREVGPFGLVRNKPSEIAQIGAAQRLLSDDRESSTAAQRADERREIRGGGGVEARFTQHGFRHHGVATMRRQDDGPFGDRTIQGRVTLASRRVGRRRRRPCSGRRGVLPGTR